MPCLPVDKSGGSFAKEVMLLAIRGSNLLQG